MFEHEELQTFALRRFDIAQRFEDSMHLRELAPDDAEGTLVLIHGLGESALCFERLMVHPRLARWRQLAPDLPGYGKSLWRTEPLSLDEHADDLAEWLDKRVPEPVVLLGHSMGGVIGLLLAERLGSRLRAFVNVEGNLSLADCGFSSQAARYSQAAWVAGGLDEVLERILASDNESLEVSRAYAASIQLADPRAYHRNSDDLVRMSSGLEIAGRLAALEQPLLYVHGIPRGVGERSLGLLEAEGVKTVGIEGAGHWPFLDQTEAVAEALEEFLASLPAAVVA